MGILRRLFGKKESDADKLLNFDEQMPEPMDERPIVPEIESHPFQSPALPPHLEEPGLAPTTPSSVGGQQRDLELINSKLDTIKAILGSMDQRIANLERAAGVEQKKTPW